MSALSVARGILPAVCLLGCCTLPAPADEVRMSDLTPELRQHVNRVARRAPIPSVDPTSLDMAGDAVAWTLSRLPMSDQEEVAHARTAHIELLRTARLVETPESAQAVFARLLKHLPARFQPPAFRYDLFTLDDPSAVALTLGGGRVYVTTGMLEQLADPQRGDSALAWTLAHELGHVARRHCRRGYQWQELEADVRRRMNHEAFQRMREWVETLQAEGDGLARFVYSPQQEARADLFALHLCRNAGFDLDAGLDALRLQALESKDWTPLSWLQELIEGPANVRRGPLLRLKRLRMELAGEYSQPERFGLFLYDRAGGRFEKAADAAVPRQRRAVVFVHGIESTHENFLAAAGLLAEADNDCLILGYRWPDDESLARVGEHLLHEVARVCREPDQVSFVCHSAGGLAFRYYAEVKRGRFHRAVFLGTPHQGSELSPLRVLMEGGKFLGDVNLGLPAALEQTSLDGQGQVAHDLRPGSLFLQYLNAQRANRDRYSIIRGRAMGAAAGLALVVAVDGGKQVLERLVDRKVRRPRVRELCLRSLHNARVPDEISQGDLAVSLESAALAGVTQIETVKLNHLQLKSDPAVLRRVAELLHTAE